MEVTKLSDFLKQQGDTPQGKSTYQAFIDNFDKDYDAESFRNEKCSIAAAFQWDICPEDLEFWDIVDNKWQEVTDPENDMLWLLDGKEPPQEADEELSKQKEYPRWFKSTETEMIVQFDSLQSGKVIGGSVAFADGYYTTTWKPHTDTDTWQEVPNPELAQEQNKILDEANNIDGKRKQIGGDHYAKHTIQPFDIIREYGLDYFEGNALNEVDKVAEGEIEQARRYNIGSSDYAKYKIQPWDIWLEYNLNPWDADIIKRVLRTKQGQSREEEYQKIIHICKERLRQIKKKGN